jgi:hypothetical protein
MLKVISSEKFSFQSYQNKKESVVQKGLILFVFDTMNKNANSADVRRHNREAAKAQRKRHSLLKRLILNWLY